MNKTEFIEKLSSELDTSKVEAGRYLDKIFKCIATSMKDNDELRFVGFGSFKAKNTEAKEVRTQRNNGESTCTKKGKFFYRFRV
jgi:nucleoid DNA-binding protein